MEIWAVVARMALAIFVYMTILFLLALVRKRNDIADVGWGVGFILVDLASLWISGNVTPRKLLILALVLTFVTNRILGVQAGIMYLSLATITCLTLAFVAQALAWGIALPKFETGNAAQIPTSLGGMLFMLGALTSLAAVLTVQLWLLRGYILSGLPGRASRDPTSWEIGSALLATIVLTGALTAFPYLFARRRVGAGPG